MIAHVHGDDRNNATWSMPAPALAPVEFVIHRLLAGVGPSPLSQAAWITPPYGNRLPDRAGRGRNRPGFVQA
jgi:hypothetical protein